jgi:hypothetical protein
MMPAAIPPQKLQTSYCCLIATDDAHKEQETGLESFYKGGISLEEIPAHGDTKLDVSLHKHNCKLQSKGKLLTAGQVELPVKNLLKSLA